VARIAGVDLPRNKRIEIALTYIFGIGRPRARAICEKAGVPLETRTDQLGEGETVKLREIIERDYTVEGGTKVRDLSEEEVSKIREFIDRTYKVEGDLRRETAQDIKRKIEIGCYQGIRHRRGLPVRGQRTHTNARTRKGPKKTIAGRKKAQAKK